MASATFEREGANLKSERPLNCFVSFSAASSQYAAQVAELLQKLGVETYRADLLPGQEIRREIMMALRAADLVCLIVGEASPSPNMAFEAGLAMGLGKPVLALATGPTIPFDFADGVQLIRVPAGDITSAKRDIARFVRHVRPEAKAKPPATSPASSPDWVGAELARIRQSEGGQERERALVDFVARLFEGHGSEVLREDQASRARIDLLVWDDTLVTELGGPLIVECKYYGGGSGSVLVNARHAFKQLEAYVAQSSARLGLLVFDHDRPTDLSLREQETPDALAFFVGDLAVAVAEHSLGDEIRRRRARAARLRVVRGDPG